MAILDRLKLDLGSEGVDKDELLNELLNRAKTSILRKLYPYDSTITVLPLRYEDMQIDIAIYLFNKRGAEGQTQHTVNGISRTYESGGIPNSMLSDIIPMVGVPK